MNVVSVYVPFTVGEVAKVPLLQLTVMLPAVWEIVKVGGPAGGDSTIVVKSLPELPAVNSAVSSLAVIDRVHKANSSRDPGRKSGVASGPMTGGVTVLSATNRAPIDNQGTVVAVIGPR